MPESTIGTYELVERDLRSSRVVHEPPRVCTKSPSASFLLSQSPRAFRLTSKHGGGTNISTNNKVTEEQPARDQRLLGRPRRTTHDGRIGRVETESGSGKTIRDEVDPEELNGDESFGHAKEDCEEDAVVEREGLARGVGERREGEEETHETTSPMLDEMR